MQVISNAVVYDDTATYITRCMDNAMLQSASAKTCLPGKWLFISISNFLIVDTITKIAYKRIETMECINFFISKVLARSYCSYSLLFLPFCPKILPIPTLIFPINMGIIQAHNWGKYPGGKGQDLILQSLLGGKKSCFVM